MQTDQDERIAAMGSSSVVCRKHDKESAIELNVNPEIISVLNLDLKQEVLSLVPE